MKLKILIITLALTASAFAAIDVRTIDSAGFDKLTEAQKAALVQQVTQQVAGNTDTTSAEKLNEWVDLGTKIGKGLAGAAKETGVAVNDFALSPVGRLTTILIVWHFIGNSLLHVFGATVLLGIGLPTIHCAFNRAFTKLTYDKDGKLVSKTKQEFGDEGTIGYVACLIATFGFAMLCLFTA
jgi:hypothetical protein